ncbi:MAG TPA: quaternary ammonium compound efflux SMR transporter SugE [bacterium]|nr:quaternary ammonium compound efflux SMR transporter SugE [bacterium]
MPWLQLLIAALLEIVWAVGLKYTRGFSRTIPSMITVGGMLGSFYFLSLAVRALPIGTAYAVWTGIGALGTAIFGMIFFHESRDLIRLASIGLILLGVVGLRLSTR